MYQDEGETQSIAPHQRAKPRKVMEVFHFVFSMKNLLTSMKAQFSIESFSKDVFFLCENVAAECKVQVLLGGREKKPTCEFRHVV